MTQTSATQLNDVDIQMINMVYRLFLDIQESEPRNAQVIRDFHRSKALHVLILSTTLFGSEHWAPTPKVTQFFKQFKQLTDKQTDYLYNQPLPTKR
jgi:hypothetical protein